MGHIFLSLHSSSQNPLILAILMDLLNECFPKVLCRARDCLFEAIGRLTAWAQCHGEAELECRLCTAQVQAQKNALYGHLNVHPSYKWVQPNLDLNFAIFLLREKAYINWGKRLK